MNDLRTQNIRCAYEPGFAIAASPESAFLEVPMNQRFPDKE